MPSAFHLRADTILFSRTERGHKRWEFRHDHGYKRGDIIVLHQSRGLGFSGETIRLRVLEVVPLEFDWSELQTEGIDCRQEAFELSDFVPYLGRGWVAIHHSRPLGNGDKDE